MNENYSRTYEIKKEKNPWYKKKKSHQFGPVG